MSLPVLYSLQHCPYAMRARMGILLAEQAVLLRAIVLSNKPEAMLAVSPKGTVPVLVLSPEPSQSGTLDAGLSKPRLHVIDQSLDIMLWALNNHDPQDLLYAQTPDAANALQSMLSLIKHYDTVFKPLLENYKAAKRYHKDSLIDDRQLCQEFIAQLEVRLNQHTFIMGDTLSLADFALLPFVRQFSKVERKWYIQAPYPKLQAWLRTHLDSPLFSKTMALYPLWLDEHQDCPFGT